MRLLPVGEREKRIGLPVCSSIAEEFLIGREFYVQIGG